MFETTSKYNRSQRDPLSRNYQQISVEILQQIRGDLTQRKASERLGFSFNQFGKWETLVTQIKWNDFVMLCSLFELSLENSFKKTFWNFSKLFSADSSFEHLIDRFALHLSHSKRPIHKYSQLKGKQYNPDLAEVIEILDLVPGSLISFLSLFLKPSELPTLKAKAEFYEKCANALYDNPKITIVNEVFKLQSYLQLDQHSDEFVSNHSACLPNEVKECIQTLVSLGLIIFDGKKYVSAENSFAFSTSQNLKLRTLTKFITDLTADRYTLTPANLDPALDYNKSVSSVRTVALSKEAAQKVSDLVMKFHLDVSQIVEEDNKPKNNVQLILLHSYASNLNLPKN